MRAFIVGFVGFALILNTGGDESAPGPTVINPTAIKEQSPLIQLPSKRVPVKSVKRGKRREQKETEGSEAPDRFEADTILKSQYHDRGQPLEVDPD